MNSGVTQVLTYISTDWLCWTYNITAGTSWPIGI